MVLLILLKMVVMLSATPGMIAPAATATNPAIRAYSIRSCPRLSFSSTVMRLISDFIILDGLSAVSMTGGGGGDDSENPSTDKEKSLIQSRGSLGKGVRRSSGATGTSEGAPQKASYFPLLNRSSTACQFTTFHHALIYSARRF